jgi:hypothetical protein
MGQISYPILNRYGYSMYWDNMWDNLQYYNRFFMKSLFFNLIFFNIFNFYLTLNFFFYTKNFYKNINYCRNKYKNFFLNLNLNSYKYINYNYGKSLNNVYPGKVWIFIIEQWYIISIFLYNSVFTKEDSEIENIKVKNIFPYMYSAIFSNCNIVNINKYKYFLKENF